MCASGKTSTLKNISGGWTSNLLLLNGFKRDVKIIMIMENGFLRTIKCLVFCFFFSFSCLVYLILLFDVLNIFKVGVCV